MWNAELDILAIIKGSDDCYELILFSVEKYFVLNYIVLICDWS